MLVVPVLIIVALFLGWLLVRLTLNALALFAGVFTTSLAHEAGVGLIASLCIGALCAVGTAAIGRNAGTFVHAPVMRLWFGLAFAIPAGAAAWSAAHGISALFTADTGWRAIGSGVVAILIGMVAWQKVAGSHASADL